MNCKVRELFMFDLISKFRGNVDAKLWASCSAANIHPITESATRLLASVPPTFGSCAMLSSAWATLLRERYNIPAVVVAGDLVLDGVPVFVSSQNLPDGKSSGLQDFGEWNGHCWINVGGKLATFRFSVLLMLSVQLIILPSLYGQILDAVEELFFRQSQILRIQICITFPSMYWRTSKSKDCGRDWVT